jgi:hypothetical protein
MTRVEKVLDFGEDPLEPEDKLNAKLDAKLVVESVQLTDSWDEDPLELGRADDQADDKHDLPSTLSLPPSPQTPTSSSGSSAILLTRKGRPPPILVSPYQEPSTVPPMHYKDHNSVRNTCYIELVCMLIYPLIEGPLRSNYAV